MLIAYPGAPNASCDSGLACSGGECPGLWWLVLSSSVLVEREAVDHQRVTDQVQELALVAEAVRPAEPETVIKRANHPRMAGNRPSRGPGSPTIHQIPAPAPGFLPRILQPPPSWGMQKTGLTRGDARGWERTSRIWERIAFRSPTGRADR